MVTHTAGLKWEDGEELEASLGCKVRLSKTNTKRRKRKRFSPVMTPRNLRLPRLGSLWLVDAEVTCSEPPGPSPACSGGLAVCVDRCSKLPLSFSTSVGKL